MTHILGKSPLARYRAWYAMNEMLKQITARSFIVTHKLCIDMCTTVSYYNRKVYINLLFYFILIYFFFIWTIQYYEQRPLREVTQIQDPVHFKENKCRCSVQFVMTCAN